MSSREMKEYLCQHHVSQLLEVPESRRRSRSTRSGSIMGCGSSLVTGLLYHRPKDPVGFLLSCLITTRGLGGPEGVTGDTFIHLEGALLDPRSPRTKPQTPSSTSTPTQPPELPAIPSQAQPPSPIPQVPPIKTKPLLALPKALLPSNSTHEIPSASIQPPLPEPTTAPPELLGAAAGSKAGPPALAAAPPTPTGVPHGPAPTAVLSAPVGAPPAPTGPPQVQAEVTEDEVKCPSRDASPAVCSQLSIDSDSGMTESSGLLQEVGIHPARRPRPLIIFIIGGPGSGKGSQTAKLTHRFGLRGISLDELLRRQLTRDASPSRKWEVISEMMNQGELGPQEDTVSELRQQLVGQPDFRGFIVDGFPRDVHQALSFQEQMGSPDLVMLLLCSNETLRCRLQQRATRLGLLGDSSHALQRRLDKFEKDIVSVSRYYRQLHLLVQVDADRDEEVVFADLSSAIRERQLVRDPSDAAGIPDCSSADPTHFDVSPLNQ